MQRQNFKIFKGNIIYTKTKDEFTIIENGYVIVDENGIILDTVKTLPQQYYDYPIYDYGNNMIIPSFTDLHIHAPQFRNRGLCLDYSLIDWLFKCTFPEEGKFFNLDYARVVFSNVIKELWRCGILHSLVYSTIHKDTTKLLLDMFIESGLSAYVGKVNMDMDAPPYLNEDTEQSLIDTEEIITEYQGKSRLVKPIITPRFVPSCTPKLLTGLGELARKYNTPVMSHLSEALEEIEIVKKMYPTFPNYGSIYDYYGLFGQELTAMAHCVYSPIDEIQLMKKNGVYAVHSPTSNCNLGSGMMNARLFLDMGVNMGLGCDVSGGSRLDSFTVMRYTLSVSKMIWIYSNKKYEPLKISEAFYLATKGGGSFFGKVGSFEPGYYFNALIVDDMTNGFFNYSLNERIQKLIFLGNENNIKERFMFGSKLPEPKFNL